MFWLENFLKSLHSRMASCLRIRLNGVTLCAILVMVSMFSSAPARARARASVCVCVCVTKHLAH